MKRMVNLNLKRIIAGLLSLCLFVSCFTNVSATDYYHEMKSLYEGMDNEFSGIRNSEDAARSIFEVLEKGVVKYNDGTLDKNSNFGKVVAFYMSCKKSKLMSEEENKEFLKPYFDLIDTIDDKDSALEVINKLQDELDLTYGAMASNICEDIVSVYYRFVCSNYYRGDDGEYYYNITNDDNVTVDVLEGIMDRAFKGCGKSMVSDELFKTMCGLFSKENIESLKLCLKMITEKGLVDPISKYLFLDSSELSDEQAYAKKKKDALKLIYTIKDKESALRVMEELDLYSERVLQGLEYFGESCCSPKLSEWKNEVSNKGEMRRFFLEKGVVSEEVYNRYDREDNLDRLLEDGTIPILKMGLEHIVLKVFRPEKSFAKTNCVIAAQVGPGYYEAILEGMLEEDPRAAEEFEKSKELFEEVKKLYIQKIQSSENFSEETKTKLIENLKTNLSYNESKDENWEEYIPESFKLCNTDYDADNFLHNVKVNAKRFHDLREAMDSIPNPVANCIKYYLLPINDMYNLKYTSKAFVTGQAVLRNSPNQEGNIIFSLGLMSEYISNSNLYASLENAKYTSEQASKILISKTIAHEISHYVDNLFDTDDKIETSRSEELGIISEDEKKVIIDKREKLKEHLEKKYDVVLMGASEAFADLCACEIMMEYGKEHGIDTSNLFFILSHKEFNEELSADDGLHPPSVARVNEIFSNMDEFYEAMKKDGREITPDDDMYIAPEDRVHIF